MKTLVEFLNESVELGLQHDEKNKKFTFNGNDNCLTYNDEVVTYPCQKDAIEIETLSVKDLRKGIGTQLVNALKNWAKKDIVVFANPLSDKISEDDLIEFYKKNGFAQDPECKDDKHCLIFKKK